MEIKIVKEPITRDELSAMAREGFGDLVKAVVDVKQRIMAVGGELHSDEEVILTEKEGSEREYTWGINIYPEKQRDEWIEFDSMINLKPDFGNRSRGVGDTNLQKKIKEVVDKLIVE